MKVTDTELLWGYKWPASNACGHLGELVGGPKFCSNKIIRISQPDSQEERLGVGAGKAISRSCSRGTRVTETEGGAPKAGAEDALHDSQRKALGQAAQPQLPFTAAEGHRFKINLGKFLNFCNFSNICLLLVPCFSKTQTTETFKMKRLVPAFKNGRSKALWG